MYVYTRSPRSEPFFSSTLDILDILRRYELPQMPTVLDAHFFKFQSWCNVMCNRYRGA